MKLIGKKAAIIAAVATATASVGSAVIAPPAGAAIRSCSSGTLASQRPTVRYGDTGSCVRELQVRLNKHGYGLATDGVFGPKTLSATKRYQTSVKIVTDGIVGPITWGKLLGAKVMPPPLPKPPVGNKLSSGISTSRTAITNCQNTTGYSLLTFDDGISPSRIDSLLATLRAKNVRAIFFFKGDYARANPGVMNKITRAGMLLGNHTYNHPALTPLSDASIRWQINNGVRSTVSPKLLRPPYGDGAYNKRVQAIAKSMGYGLCFWQVDTRDWDDKNTHSTADIIRRVRYGDKWTPPISRGGVVLMHGTGRYSVAATAGVIDAMRARGATPLPLH